MMKLAYRVFFVSLVCLSLVAAALAQTAVSVDKSKRSSRDDRNTAPTFGTGGPMGGPTGLFTVYDGQTLRRGEYTFSATYSNFDRDPGDVDITEVPLNFQIGVTNNFELFFNTDGYRAVKVNSPGNLSSFYLPNSRINGVSRGAIILAPSGPGNGIGENRAVFRPVGSQPFVQYPFVGGSAGNFGFPAGQIGPVFGFPANTVPTIGVPVAGGAADNFPGMGSIYGSILPGIAFQTACSSTAAGQSVNNCTLGVIYPTVFTNAPSYLPDAPFINRTFGESAFSTYTAGGKIRFNDVNDWWGAALVAAYRFYGDSPDDFSGFNMLQRGASPGGKWSRGDILVTGAFDGRVRPWWNIAVNVGYHWNADVKGDFNGTDVTLLDRPDELLLSIGTDFPVNRYFQPIGEFRHLRYVGGRTPNAFENDPYEGLIGARVFPARWFGFSGGYRHHFNQQDQGAFGDETITNTTFVPCFNPPTPVPAATVLGPCVNNFRVATTTFEGVPPGFRTSSDPHGFFFQAFIGRRNPRQAEIINRPADVTGVVLSDTEIRGGGCPPGQRPVAGQTCDDSTSISVTTTAVDPENDVLTYNYTVSGGRIVGTGANVTWDLSGVAPGTYTITAGVDDGCGLCGKTQTQTVTVVACQCEIVCECPTATISGPAGITAPGETMTFTANVSGGTQQGAITYNWSVSGGTIESGQGTPSIVVRTAREQAGQSITATVELGGLPNCGCPATLTETGGVGALPRAEQIDEFGRLPNDDIRGRLDTFFAELSNRPGEQGYIINYGTPAQITARERLIRNHITFRNFDPSRITIVNGGTSPTGEQLTRLYRVPPGAENPTP